MKLFKIYTFPRRNMNMQVETRVRAINCLHFINGQFVESQKQKNV